VTSLFVIPESFNRESKNPKAFTERGRVNKAMPNGVIGKKRGGIAAAYKKSPHRGGWGDKEERSYPD